MTVSIVAHNPRWLPALGVSLLANLALFTLMAWLQWIASPYPNIPAIQIKLLPMAEELQVSKPSPARRSSQHSPIDAEIAPAPQPDAREPEPLEQAPAAPSPEHAIQPLHRLTRLPQFLRRIEPVYPEGERTMGREASVLVEVVIDTRGRILEATILKSAGGNFDAAVLQALDQSLFAPGYIDDKEVVVRFQIPFVFRLR